MAYNKTVWVNNNPPAINAENLNKVEQGIYDAHVAAQAVSDALAAHKVASPLDHPDGSVTDDKIGNRTADQTQAPTGSTGTLAQLLSWLANRIKAITGKANWFDNPDTTLAAAAAHIAAAAPHSGHETPAGAQAKANTAEANAKAYTDVHAAQQITSTNAVHGIKQGAGNGFDADKLDGYDANTGTVANTIPVRDSSGGIVFGKFKIVYNQASNALDFIYTG